MMPAGIGAAADFDVQLLDFWIGVIVQLARKNFGQRKRARDPQIAGGCSRASSDVRNGARSGGGQIQCAELVIDYSRAVKRYPRNDKILIDGDADAAQFVLLQHIREPAQWVPVQRSGR